MPCEVVESQVHVQRNLTHIRRHGATAVFLPERVDDGFRVEATDNDTVAITAALIHHVDTRNVRRQFRQIVEALLLDLGSTNRRNVDRNVLHGLRAPRRRHDDFLDLGICRHRNAGGG